MHIVERARHLLKRWRNYLGQANRGGLSEIVRGGGLAGYLVASLRHASLVRSEDGVKLLLDVFGHCRYPASTPCT
jgi:hypothetical protein